MKVNAGNKRPVPGANHESARTTAGAPGTGHRAKTSGSIATRRGQAIKTSPGRTTKQKCHFTQIRTASTEFRPLASNKLLESPVAVGPGGRNRRPFSFTASRPRHTSRLSFPAPAKEETSCGGGAKTPAGSIIVQTAPRAIPDEPNSSSLDRPGRPRIRPAKVETDAIIRPPGTFRKPGDALPRPLTRRPRRSEGRSRPRQSPDAEGRRPPAAGPTVG